MEQKKLAKSKVDDRKNGASKIILVNALIFDANLNKLREEYKAVDFFAIKLIQGKIVYVIKIDSSIENVYFAKKNFA